ncbi:hypothetical protein QWY93_11160 [Echinicola jeungdonensis]|uniref:Tetratricopeptide repeat protein n=1 Tax=Echinicola jeungdonensis TaxID=709343 RepID=A0ABV5J666_9BACT|nr:hypothetical protein [Echinicola jeungdonensis]MDN3669883.1 hypothetical protein [Echinicola jeungdonensis]
MPLISPEKINKTVFKGLPIIITVIGSFLLVYQYFFQLGHSMPIEPGVFTEMVKVPLDYFQWPPHTYSLEVNNHLLFQNFESLPPLSHTTQVLVFGGLFWVLVSLGTTLISTFKRWYFIASMILVIILLTLSGVNALNIGSISSNFALIILIIGLVAPAMFIHVFGENWSLLRRLILVFPISLLTIASLIYFSPVQDPALLFAENITLMGLGITSLFLLYIGHAVIGALFIFLANLNQDVGIKISLHLTFFTLLYLGAMVLFLLDLNGSIELPFAIPSLFWFFIFVGFLGWIETRKKIKQFSQPYKSPLVGQSLFWIGFGISALVFWKAGFSQNRPMMDFLNHWFTYTQISLSLLFFIYTMANFSGYMDSGNPIEKVIFRPKFFAYYHMRLGAAIALLSLIVYTDGIIAPQLSTSSTNFSADYYYATNRPLEARILYENSWARYRRNDKAKNAVAHLYLIEKQPTLALEHLNESLAQNPNINDIILLSSLVHKRGEYFDAVFYLEKGLEFFPDSPILKNNLALMLSKGNKGEEAYQLLSQIASPSNTILANTIGIQAKHLRHLEVEIPTKNDPISQTNHLAYKNRLGDFSDFQISPDTSRHLELITLAALRNQWTNKVHQSLAKDIGLVDTLLKTPSTPNAEEELRITRVIRSYQSQDINSALKYLNGLAFNFSNSAGYYHSLSAYILIGQGDFKRAALELLLAEEKGFENFQQKHLPILYFGNQPNEAFRIQKQYELEFPSWMIFDENGDLKENEQSKFFNFLAHLIEQVKSNILPALETIDTPKLKAILANEILWKKGHWLEKEEIQQMINLVKTGMKSQEGQAFFQEMNQVMLKKTKPENAQLLLNKGMIPSSGKMDSNPYNTFMVMEAMNNAQSDEEKYKILREAADFNRDPLLWLEMIKYSRKIGLAHYGTAALQQLSQWVEPKTLEKLQLQTF